MALTLVDKNRILKKLKENSDVYYCYFFDGAKKNAYNDYDVLNFLLTYVIGKLDGQTKTSEKILVKMLSSIKCMIYWMHHEREMLTQELQTMVYSLKDKYDNYTEALEIDKNDLITNALVAVYEELDRFYVDEEEPKKVQEENCSELENRIKELMLDIEKLNEDIAKDKKEMSKKDRAIKKKDSTIISLQTQLEQQDQAANKAASELNDKLKLVETLENKIKDLEEELNGYNKEQGNWIKDKELLLETRRKLSEEVQVLKKQIEEKTKEIKRIKESNKEKDDKKEEKRKKEKELELVKEIVFSLLLFDSYTFDELQIKLGLEGYNLSNKDMNKVLASLSQSYNISNSNHIQYPLKYKISSPLVPVDTNFNINLENDIKSFDILLVSDYHLQNFSSSVQYELDKVQEYCVTNGIGLVMNLGDFFGHAYVPTSNLFNNFQETERLIEKIAKLHPHDRTVKYAILGGNHDKNLFRYGFDPLKRLQEARPDFISLGYNHCNITFNNLNTVNSSFAIHHMNSKFPEPVTEEKYDTIALSKSLDSFYSSTNKARQDSYIDILGHFHKSRLDASNSWCIVPSLFMDRQQDGAWHLKIYFDKAKNINYMIFIPLVLGEKLEPVSEIAYQKMILEKK